MANRAYLYSESTTLNKLRDLSESRHPIPLVYKIVLGCNTKIVESKIWNYPHPIAIQGNFKLGLERLHQFYDYLKTQDIETAKIEVFQKETIDFFTKHSDRKLELFFMEAGEIYDLIGDAYPLEEQNQALFNTIVAISEDIKEILDKKPINVFAHTDKDWLKDLKSDINLIEPYWTHVTYFSFNNS